MSEETQGVREAMRKPTAPCRCSKPSPGVVLEDKDGKILETLCSQCHGAIRPQEIAPASSPATDIGYSSGYAYNGYGFSGYVYVNGYVGTVGDHAAPPPSPPSSATNKKRLAGYILEDWGFSQGGYIDEGKKTTEQEDDWTTSGDWTQYTSLFPIMGQP